MTAALPSLVKNLSQKCELIDDDKGGPQVPAPLNGPTAPPELSSFVDSFFAGQMERLHIPGAVVVFVKDGQVLYEKGYGYADVSTKIP